MAKQGDFDKFLSNIEPSSTTVSYISSVQNNLRDYLKDHISYSEIYVDSFLSGSYAKHTCIRPAMGDKKRDVDIVIVTNHCLNDNSSEVLDELLEAIQESSKYKTAKMQHHSIGIVLSQISVDIVPVIQDDYGLYYVCDSETGEWNKTDPKGHKEWSTAVNQSNNLAYKPLVKIFKWWRRIHCPEGTKYPKGITLEKLVADNLGDTKQSIENLLIETMQNIISAYKEEYVDQGLLPIIDDPSEKILENNLLEGYSFEDFSSFVCKIEKHVELLNSNGTGNDIWRTILGDEFPNEEKRSSSYNMFTCIQATHRQKPIWPMAHGGVVFVSARVIGLDGEPIEYVSNGLPLEKGCSLYFKAITGVKQPFTVKWQITNTGNEARNANCLRGNFEDSDNGILGKNEVTAYSGSHSVQCYIIKNSVCVAKSRDYIINVR